MLNRLFCFLLIHNRPELMQLTSAATAAGSNGQDFWQNEVRLHNDVVPAAGTELLIAPGRRVIFEPPAGRPLL